MGAGQGKSATDLIAHLAKTANDKVDQAVMATKLTAAGSEPVTEALKAH